MRGGRRDVFGYSGGNTTNPFTTRRNVQALVSWGHLTLAYTPRHPVTPEYLREGGTGRGEKRRRVGAGNASGTGGREERRNRV